MTEQGKRSGEEDASPVSSLPAAYDLLAGLSQRRREVIAPVFENPGAYVLLTVRALAEELGSDPATTLRIVRGMGFAGYREFQKYLHELSLALASPLDRWQELSDQSVAVGLVDKVLQLDVANLEAMRASLDAEALVRLGERVAEAPRILVLGGDLATSLVHYLSYHFAALGIPCLRGTTPGETEHLAYNTGPDDLVIGMSFGPGLRQTVEALRVASSNGAHCVGIADTLVSPVVRYSHEFYLTPRSSVSIGESYVAPLSLLNALLAACAAADPERTRRLLSHAAESQRSGYRWYRDE